MTQLEYFKLSKFNRFLYKLGNFFKNLGLGFVKFWVKFGKAVAKGFLKFIGAFVLIGNTFIRGSWKTKVSYLIFGFGNLSRKQFLRGLFFLLFEVLFILYMVFYGSYWLGKMDNLGDRGAEQVKIDGFEITIYHDDSFKILLYGILTIFFIIAFIATWYINVKQCKVLDEIVASGKKIKSDKDDLRSLVDNEFHKTLLALPVTGIMLFTVLPIIFMIVVAFTNYGGSLDGRNNLFTWVGLENFNELFTVSTGNSSLIATIGEILGWTLIWAFFATFTNYFIGMFVAMMINKKGIRGKKIWRGILVLTIAVPQFISLVYVSNLFADNGIVNKLLMDWGVIDKAIHFWTDNQNPIIARALVILINIWIGIPYLVLITTGVLMNIPADLYESAEIDGANKVQQFSKITLPYMLFVTGPYLLTSFIGNINNFNVIYLLTGGSPDKIGVATSAGTVGHTDLLITWLFDLTMGATANYSLAAVIGIIIFLVVSIISLIVYNVMPSMRNEEDYS